MTFVIAVGLALVTGVVVGAINRDVSRLVAGTCLMLGTWALLLARGVDPLKGENVGTVAAWSATLVLATFVTTSVKLRRKKRKHAEGS